MSRLVDPAAPPGGGRGRGSRRRRVEEEHDGQQLEVALQRRHRLGERDDFEREAEVPGGEVRGQGSEQIPREQRGRRDAMSLSDQARRSSASGQSATSNSRNLFAKRSVEKPLPAPKVHGIELHPPAFVNRGGHFRRVVGDEEMALPPLPDDVQDPPLAAGDDRSAAGQGLDRRDPEVLDPRLEEAERAPVELPERPRVHPAVKLYPAVRCGEPLEPWPLRPLADDFQSDPGVGGGGDRQIHAFVRGERRHQERVRTLGRRLRRRGEEGRVHGWRQHLGAAAVVLADPGRHEAGVREVEVHPAGGRHVPAPERCEDPIAEGADCSPPRSEVRFLLIPDVAHRGVAVADVAPLRSPAGPLGDAVAGREDEPVTGQGKALDREWEERQIPAVAGIETGRALQEAGVDRVALDLGIDRARKVEQRVDRRARNEARDLAQDVLAPALTGQPVVNERHRVRHVRPPSRSASTSR
jgi:hypothetical protein